MVKSHIQSNFARSGERRVAETVVQTEHRKTERRNERIDWVPLFREVDGQALEEALGICKVLLLDAGTSLLRPGETNRNVYVLLSGEVTAHLDVNQPPDAGISLAKGECLGELSAIDGKPVSALVVALSECRFLVIPGEVFWGRLMILPGVAKNLMITITERMRKTNEQAMRVQQQQMQLVHIRRELDVARQLQISMVPLQRPIFPDRDDIEVCGLMEPASDVGGDFFDAFFVDDTHLFFCIGDVSGHGIAAALFMARTIGLLHTLAMNTLHPEKLLETLNNRLCTGNETNIFVTLFCGYFDVNTGKLLYSNGGHCPPVLFSRNRATLLPIPKGALIGAFSGMKYLSMECTVSAGETLLCYTDGVTEAQNQSGEEFADDRLVEISNRHGATELSLVLDTIRLAVSEFTCKDALEDDCTMLAIRPLHVVCD